MDWKYNEEKNRIVLVDGEPKSKRKITGTRLAGVLGLNPWNTPFQMWCEITKAAKPDFEDTVYTLAGKAIEPKQIEYTKKVISEKVLSPEEFFGNRYNDVRYDFYPKDKIFGGMWDAKLVRTSGKVSDIFEYKTTKRSEDWVNGVPVYYLLQVLEYAYLEGAKRVHLVVSFLEDDDYNRPENFKVTDDNTQIFTYNVEDTIVADGTIGYHINKAKEWYNKYIKTGISPKFDEDKDEEYLDILRSANPGNDTELDDLISNANNLIQQIEHAKKELHIDDMEKNLKALESAIKDKLMACMGENDTKCKAVNYTLSKSVRVSKTYDEDAMSADGVLDKYVSTTEKDTFTLRKSKLK